MNFIETKFPQTNKGIACVNPLTKKQGTSNTITWVETGTLRLGLAFSDQRLNICSVATAAIEAELDEEIGVMERRTLSRWAVEAVFGRELKFPGLKRIGDGAGIAGSVSPTVEIRGATRSDGMVGFLHGIEMNGRKTLRKK